MENRQLDRKPHRRHILSPSVRSHVGRYRRWQTGLIAIIVAGIILLGRSLGLLEPLELSALDYLLRIRPLGSIDRRIVLVTIDEEDLNYARTWPIADQTLASLLSQIRAYQPRVIGLDIYRNLPVEPGQAALQQIFTSTPNLIGIEKLANPDSVGVSPPKALANRGNVGFSNVVIDADGKVRRSLLFWQTPQGLHTSLSMQLAQRYLEVDGITPETVNPEQPRLKLGKNTLTPLTSSFGSYTQLDTGGYQVMAELHGLRPHFQTISMRQVLMGKAPEALMRDRIVLIGTTAASLRNEFYTSFSYRSGGEIEQISGIELHAHFTRQLLDAALGLNQPLKALPDSLESGWIGVWALVGVLVCGWLRSPLPTMVAILVVSVVLSGLCYGLLLLGWWIPWAPSVVGLLLAAIVNIGYNAHQEEALQKSKDFLNSIINAIPDPVFVKDKRYRWILLNTAYSQFAGYPLDALIDHTEFDILPDAQAQRFWQADHQTFAHGHHESEDEFTSAYGTTFRISTKRSLHYDAVGNVFLVGTIRDITQLKQREDELRRTAEELSRSNAALRAIEHQLRYMAYYDTLTNLPNRDLFQDRLSQAIEGARDRQHSVALLFLDLDGFKQINDTYGHLMGDLILKAVAQRLNGCLRSSDTVARLGGDEFVVLLPAVPIAQDVIRVADKILTTLCQNFVIEGNLIHLTTSIGISLFPGDGSEIQSLLKAADQAMYQAKDAGKNQYHFFSTPIDAALE
jgi:diguanylate cyclase (GGDEF)-like protein/PAS domain S-box-containing protein